jgi:hypothetical protein
LATIELSVVVPISDGCWRVADVLAAVGDATRGLAAEVLAVDGSRDGSGVAVPSHPPFRKIQARAGSNAALLRAQGVASAAGEVVALLEPWTLPSTEWATELLSGHRKSPSDSVIGGPVVYDGPDRAWAWAEFLFEYGAFLPPLAGEVEELAVNNVSYRGDLLRRVRASWENGFWKHFLHGELRRSGVRFRAMPGAIVRHARVVPFSRFLRERIDHGRAYAARRGGPHARALLAPLLPVLLTSRLARRLADKPAALPLLLRAFPELLLAQGAWSLGEALGHLAGDGGSSARVF